MWKCQYCEKMNFDDQKICPYCNAPNPASVVQKQSSENTFQQNANSQNRSPNDRNTTQRDQTAMFYSDQNSGGYKNNKKHNFRTFMWIGVALFITVLLIIVLIQPREKDDQAASTGQQGATVKESIPEIEKTQAPQLATAAPTATPEPEPTNEPFDVQAVIPIYLDFGQIYQCNTGDFVLPYDVDEDDITWSCVLDDSGTQCTPDGRIIAGNIQISLDQKYNDAVVVTGTMPDGSTLTYQVLTGSGTSYESTWSSGGRNMKRFYGSVFVISPMIVQCSGFSMYYEYELTNGKIDTNRWSVWVRENGTDWVYIKDITMENQVGDVYDIEFDHPISFSEIAVQPETYSNYYEYYPACAVGYLIFD